MSRAHRIVRSGSLVVGDLVRPTGPGGEARRAGLLLLLNLLLLCSLAPAWRPLPARAAGCAASLTLRLRAGVPSPRGMTPPMPAPALAPIPPGAVSLRVPLYPGAAPTTAREPMPSTDYPITPYLKVASATFRLPANATAAPGWYQQQFARCGYTQNGGSQSGDRQGNVSTGLRFIARGNPNLQVELSFEAVAGHTLVLYVAEDITIPPRPAGSYLPADLRQVRITYVLPIPQPPATGPQPKLYRTVADPIALRPLVRAINALTTIDAGAQMCPADSGQSATLIFQQRNGRPIRVYDEPTCGGVTVGPYPPLWDLSHVVWNAITSLVYAGGTPTPTATPR